MTFKELSNRGRFGVICNNHTEYAIIIRHLVIEHNYTCGDESLEPNEVLIEYPFTRCDTIVINPWYQEFMLRHSANPSTMSFIFGKEFIDSCLSALPNGR